MTYWIGLTGGIGSGKTQVSDMFEILGVPVIDTDVISRQLTAKDGLAIPMIESAFGADILDENQHLDRVALRKRIFSSEDDKKRLESILHPLIYKDVLNQLNIEAVYGVIVIPLLTKQSLFWPLLDRILLVDAPEDVQIHRVMQRSGLNPAEILSIIASQSPRAERLAISDDIIDNSGNLSQLEDEVKKIHTFYVDFFKNGQPS